MNNKTPVVILGILGVSLIGNVWLGCELSAEKADNAAKAQKIAELTAETERLDNALWKVGRGIDFKKPFGVKPGMRVDEASIAAKFFETEGGYVGFRPADMVAEKDSKCVAEVSGFMERTFKTEAEAQKAAAVLRTWMTFWMEGSPLEWSVAPMSPEPGWDWRVRFRVADPKLAEIIRKRQSAQ